jgi:nucleoside-diphosphate kinase
MEETLSIIKPDGVSKNIIGAIFQRFENAGLKIVNLKRLTLTTEEAGEFYNMHKERPFYPELVKFMTSGPCIPFVVKGNNAILKVRELMGATDPSEAETGSIRADFADSIDRNIIHGSDSKESAQREISFFFE